MHPLNWTVETKQSATSTSDLAKQAALEGAPHGSGYLAIEQTAGRGRRGRHWADAVAELHLREHAHDGEPVESGEIRCRLVFIKRC